MSQSSTATDASESTFRFNPYWVKERCQVTGKWAVRQVFRDHVVTAGWFEAADAELVVERLNERYLMGRRPGWECVDLGECVALPDAVSGPVSIAG